MSYTDLSTLSTVFDVHLKIKEKQRFIGKKNKVSYPKMETSKRRKQPNSKENDSADEGFLGRILHSGVLSSYIFNFC